MTIGSGITIRGSSGTIGEGSWYAYPDDAIVNQGTVAADGSGGLAMSTITINATSFTNQGSLQASNKETLNVGGTFTMATSGLFDSNGGTLNITGTLKNSGSTLALTAATGSLTFSGTIQRGTITESGGAELMSANGTLDGVTVAGVLDLASNNATVYIVDGLVLNNATVYLGNTTGSTYGDLCFEGTQTLGGTGTVLFGASGSNFLGISKGYSDSTAYALTISSSITIRGSSGTIGDGSWYAYPDDRIVNQGTIAVDGSGGLANGTVSINPLTFSNQGTIQDSNGETLKCFE